MNERVDTSYSGLLNRLSDGAYFTPEERERLPRILEASLGIQAHATHELIRRMVRDGRLSLRDGSPALPGGPITAADERRGVLFVLPRLPGPEPGVLHPPLDPALGVPPALGSVEALRLFDRVGRAVFASVNSSADLQPLVVSLLDLLRDLLGVPLALFCGRDLPLPSAIARGPRSVLLGPPGQAPPPPSSIPGLPAAWEAWIRRAAAQEARATHLTDFRALAGGMPPGEGSALFLPVRSPRGQEPQPAAAWEGVLTAVSPASGWFDEERLARARLLAVYAQGVIGYVIELVPLVFVDPLTGIHNRLYFKDQFPRILSGATRRHQSCALLIIDIDDFKHFNTRYGYNAGDTVLHAIAQALDRTVRTTDVLARYGGEEFAVILAPPVSPEETLLIGERLRQAVENTPVRVPALEGGEQQVSVTVSIGGALFPQSGAIGDELWNRANQRLLRAKRAGKNRVVIDTAGRAADAEEA